MALLFLSSYNDKYIRLFPGSAEGKRANRPYFSVEYKRRAVLSGKMQDDETVEDRRPNRLKNR